MGKWRAGICTKICLFGTCREPPDIGESGFRGSWVISFTSSRVWGIDDLIQLLRDLKSRARKDSIVSPIRDSSKTMLGSGQEILDEVSPSEI